MVDNTSRAVTVGSLNSDVFERRTSTGSRLFALLSCDFEQTFGQIVSIIVETLSNTNLVAPKNIKREKSSLPVDVRRSKTLLLKLSIRELKHQTFLIHKRHGWPRRTGSRTRFACQLQLIKQNNVKPSRTPTE